MNVDIPYLAPSKCLCYELLTKNNYDHLGSLFEDDDNPFVDKRFKNEHDLLKYTLYLLHHGPYHKNGGIDWLIRLKGTLTYIGVLHLYDISQEPNITQTKLMGSCTIGFAIKQEFRRQGYGQEATKHLLNYISTHFSFQTVLSYTDKKNKAAAKLLQGIGFQLNNEDYTLSDRYDYFEWLNK